MKNWLSAMVACAGTIIIVTCSGSVARENNIDALIRDARTYLNSAISLRNNCSVLTRKCAEANDALEIQYKKMTEKLPMSVAFRCKVTEIKPIPFSNLPQELICSLDRQIHIIIKNTSSRCAGELVPHRNDLRFCHSGKVFVNDTIFVEGTISHMGIDWFGSEIRTGNAFVLYITDGNQGPLSIRAQ